MLQQHDNCTCCMIQHHTRYNVIEHLKKSKRCREYVETGPKVLSEDQANALDVEVREEMVLLQRRGLRRYHKDKAAVRAVGPLPPSLVHEQCVQNTKFHILGRGHNHRFAAPCIRPEED